MREENEDRVGAGVDAFPTILCRQGFKGLRVEPVLPAAGFRGFPSNQQGKVCDRLCTPTLQQLVVCQAVLGKCNGIVFQNSICNFGYWR